MEMNQGWGVVQWQNACLEPRDRLGGMATTAGLGAQLYNGVLAEHIQSLGSHR